jgi:hypothetical protein
MIDGLMHNEGYVLEEQNEENVQLLRGYLGQEGIVEVWEKEFHLLKRSRNRWEGKVLDGRGQGYLFLLEGVEKEVGMK